VRAGVDKLVFSPSASQEMHQPGVVNGFDRSGTPNVGLYNVESLVCREHSMDCIGTAWMFDGVMHARRFDFGARGVLAVAR
jgi:hypothetical protein